MALMSSFQIAASGMTAERLRMDVISSNLAGVMSTRTEDGGPYKRLMVEFEAAPQGNGVRAARIVQDDAPPVMVYEPGHPDADDDGYVAMPNVNLITEMVDMITASRAYEANVSAFNAAKSMAMKALEIGKA